MHTLEGQDLKRKLKETIRYQPYKISIKNKKLSVTFLTMK